MNRTTVLSRGFSPFHDHANMKLGQGNAIDWSRVSTFFNIGKFTVKLNGAVLIHAVALTVDALPEAVKKDTILDFGAETEVVVELSGNEAIAQTDLSVVALTAPIPAGALIYFGSGEQVVRVSTAAVLGATSLLVDALTIALETGDTGTYYGGRKLAKVTADALAGATSLTVDELPFAIADNAEALFDKTGSPDGRRIPIGTVMARVNGTDKLIPRRDGVVGNGEVAVGFLVSDAVEKSVSASKSGYGLVIGNAHIWENLCPDADTTTLPSLYKTELAANSLGFVYGQWGDSRLT